MATYTGTPSTATAGGTITAANWNADVRDVVNALSGAWNTHTPTVAQGVSTNITKTVTYSKYLRIGKLVIYQARLDLTAAGTAGSYISVSLPATAAASGIYVGSGAYYDQSTSTEYPANAYLATTGLVTLMQSDVTRQSAIGVAPNIAAASSDVFWLAIMYEAA